MKKVKIFLAFISIVLLDYNCKNTATENLTELLNNSISKIEKSNNEEVIIDNVTDITDNLNTYLQDKNKTKAFFKVDEFKSNQIIENIVLGDNAALDKQNSILIGLNEIMTSYKKDTYEKSMTEVLKYTYLYSQITTVANLNTLISLKNAINDYDNATSSDKVGKIIDVKTKIKLIWSAHIKQGDFNAIIDPLPTATLEDQNKIKNIASIIVKSNLDENANIISSDKQDLIKAIHSIAQVFSDINKAKKIIEAVNSA